MIRNRFEQKADDIRVIVAGTRSFTDYALAREKLDRIILGLQEDFPCKRIVIITGDANGADQSGNRYAYDRGYTLRKFPAEWRKYGRAAGPIRNAQMMDFAKETHPVLVAFWDGKSRGTKNMIDTAKREGASVYVIYYEADKTAQKNNH